MPEQLREIRWVPDETMVAGRPMCEWARHCLVELAGNGASLEELRTFCEKTGIPGRRKQYWGISTWYALLQPHVVMAPGWAFAGTPFPGAGAAAVVKVMICQARNS